MILKVGEAYSAQEIQEVLGVGNAGGIRVRLEGGQVRRIVLLTAAPEARRAGENPYHDRVEGQILVYSAGGLQGDQRLGGVNRRLLEQPDARFPIHGFRLNQNRRKAGPKRWEYLGLLQFLRVTPDRQIDRHGTLRRTWLFELRLCAEVPEVVPMEDTHFMAAAMDRYIFDPTAEAREVTTGTAVTTAAPAYDAAAVERTRAAVIRMTPREFELLVKAALESSGFQAVEVTRYTQDHGIDVNAELSPALWPVAGMRVQLQAKRWLHTVGRREVAELRGSLDPFAAGAVVTTSYFSRAALMEAAAPGKRPVVLVDGQRFAEIIHQHGLVAA